MPKFVVLHCSFVVQSVHVCESSLVNVSNALIRDTPRTQNTHRVSVTEISSMQHKRRTQYNGGWFACVLLLCVHSSGDVDPEVKITWFTQGSPSRMQVRKKNTQTVEGEEVFCSKGMLIP